MNSKLSLSLGFCLALAQNAWTQESVVHPNLHHSEYLISADRLEGDGFFEKLEKGESLGEERLISEKATKTSPPRQTSGEFFKDSHDVVTKQSESSVKLATELKIRITRNGLAPLDGKAEPSKALSAYRYREFRECALDVLPKLKQLIGAIQLKDVAGAITSYLQIAERGKQYYGDLRRGDLACGSYLGPFQIRLRHETEIARALETAMLLSTFLNLGFSESAKIDDGLLSFWAQYQTPNKETLNFWRDFWMTFSTEILLRGTRSASLDVFAERRGQLAELSRARSEYSKLKAAKP